MTRYTREDLNKEARKIAKITRQQTCEPAKVDHWELIISGPAVTLAVIVNAYDGQRQINIAI